VVPIATLVELLGNVPERYRALLLLATFANLRFGELAGLRRGQLNLDACEVRVNASTAEMDDGRLINGDPKSRAGTRTVAFPADIVPELADHLERFAEAGSDGFVFIGPKGGRLRRSNFREVWHRARGVVGLPDLHFHDLRHAGNTMAAAQGASLKELMERMGHSSPRAALIYLHATRERDRKIAAGMGKLFADAKKASASKPGTAPKRSGTQRARRPEHSS
jgi:integrase